MQQLSPPLYSYSTVISGADDIRLVGGADHQNSGRLEVFVDDQWGTVCDEGSSFTSVDAEVACRQLNGGVSRLNVAYGNYLYFL